MSDHSSENQLASGACSPRQTTGQDPPCSEELATEAAADPGDDAHQEESLEAQGSEAATLAPVAALLEDREPKIAALEAVLFMAAEPIP